MFKKALTYACLGLSLSGCALFQPAQYTIISADSRGIAQHNLQVLELTSDYRIPYLLVDAKGNTTPRDLYLFINKLQAPLMQYQEVVKNLIQYNQSILKQIQDDKKAGLR